MILLQNNNGKAVLFTTPTSLPVPVHFRINITVSAECSKSSPIYSITIKFLFICSCKMRMLFRNCIIRSIGQLITQKRAFLPYHIPLNNSKIPWRVTEKASEYVLEPFFLHILDTLPVSPGISSASTKMPPSVDKCHLRAPYIHTRHPLCGQAATILLRVQKNAPIRGQMPPAGTIHPHQAPSVWTGGNYFSSASTKTPPSVDKCHLRAPYIHTRHPMCGQAATISPPRPQKCPHLWTNATCWHHTSTPGTLCVDRRQLFLLRVHKNAPIRGQMPPAGTIHPHQAPSVWTDGNYFASASTKDTLFVDKTLLLICAGFIIILYFCRVY